MIRLHSIIGAYVKNEVDISGVLVNKDVEKEMSNYPSPENRTHYVDMPYCFRYVYLISFNISLIFEKFGSWILHMHIIITVFRTLLIAKLF